MTYQEEELRDYINSQTKSLRESLELVLLFHSGTYWDATKAARWKELTGNAEATTKVLCDHIRKVLGDKPNQ